MVFFIWILIAVAIHVGLTKLYKRKPPVLIEGAWIIASINVTFAWSKYGDLQAMDTAAIYGVLLALFHGLHWTFTSSKSAVKQVAESLPQKVHIDDSVFEQIAEEMSQGAIGAGLMTRAIAEADGDPNRAQAIYIKLRAAAILAEREALTFEGQIDVRKEAPPTEAASNQATQPTKVTNQPQIPPQVDLKYYNPKNEPAAVGVLIFALISFLIFLWIIFTK